jgi:glutaredoxin 3
MHVEIYTRPNCGFCESAKKLMTNSNVRYIENRLNIDFTRENLVEKYATAKTYPVVVVDGFYIGGFAELSRLLNENDKNSKMILMEN